MTVIRANFGDLNNANFYKIAFQGYTEHPMVYDQIFNVKDSKRATEYISAVSGLGLPTTKAEGADMDYDTPIQLYDGSVSHTTYAQGVRLTRESMEDDEYNILGERLFSSLGRGFNQRVETQAAAFFNNGFSSQTGPDGVAVFSASHPKNPDEATTYISNIITAADLSTTSLKAALTAFENQTDERGLKFNQKAKYLLVAPDNKWTAQEILSSALEPYVAENTKNVLNNSLQLVVWPFLTDADSWFLLSEKSQHTLNFFWRRKFNVKRDNDFDSDDAKYGASMRFSVYCEKAWLGTLGVAGV